MTATRGNASPAGRASLRTTGEFDGDGVGSSVGLWMGPKEGWGEGLNVGRADVGCVVGLGDGFSEGLDVGRAVVGCIVGLSDGLSLGL